MSARPIGVRLKLLIKRFILGFLVLSRRTVPLSVVRFLVRRLQIEFAKPEPRKFGSVSISNYKHGFPGAFCVSVDHDARRPEQRRVCREGAFAVLESAERFKLPMSWAICGVTVQQVPEVLRRITHSSVAHDIGVHTFNHLDLTDPSVSEETVKSETQRVVDLIKSLPKPVTFIFPWNREAHFSALKELGFTAYRGRDRRLGYPTKMHDLWNIHPVYYLDQKSYGSTALLKKFVDFSIAYGCVLHLWSHPWSLCVDEDPRRYVRDVLDPLFEHVDAKRREGLLWVCTMRDLADYCEARQNSAIESCVKSKDGIDIAVSCSVEDVRFNHPPEVTVEAHLPGGTDIEELRVDGEQVPLSENYRISNRHGETVLFLTLSFPEPLRHVSVKTGSH